MLKKMATPWASAVRKSPTAQPASTSRTGSTLRRRKLTAPKTTARAKAAPTNEHPTTPAKLMPGRSAKQSASAKAAPALMPRSPESAKGLRVTPCMMAPATAKAAPTRMQPTVRGPRSSRMATCSWFAMSGEKSAPSTWSGGMGVLPKNRESPAASATATTPPIRKIDVLRRDTKRPC